MRAREKPKGARQSCHLSHLGGGGVYLTGLTQPTRPLQGKLGPRTGVKSLVTRGAALTQATG